MRQPTTPCYVYVLGTDDGGAMRTYVGWTTDLNSRLAAHNSGKGAKSTRGRQVDFAIRGTSSQPQRCDEPRMAFKTGSAVSAPAHCDLKIVVVGWKNLLDQDFVDQVLPLDIRQMGALFIVC